MLLHRGPWGSSIHPKRNTHRSFLSLPFPPSSRLSYSPSSPCFSFLLSHRQPPSSNQSTFMVSPYINGRFPLSSAKRLCGIKKERRSKWKILLRSLSYGHQHTDTLAWQVETGASQNFTFYVRLYTGLVHMNKNKAWVDPFMILWTHTDYLAIYVPRHFMLYNNTEEARNVCNNHWLKRAFILKSYYGVGKENRELQGLYFFSTHTIFVLLAFFTGFPMESLTYTNTRIQALTRHYKASYFKLAHKHMHTHWNHFYSTTWTNPFHTTTIKLHFVAGLLHYVLTRVTIGLCTLQLRSRVQQLSWS